MSRSPTKRRPRRPSILLAPAFTAGAVAVLGASARLFPALDVLNSFAPLVLAVALACGAAAARRRAGRGWALLAMAAGLLGAAPRLYPEFSRPLPTTSAGATSAGGLRLLTYNVWRGNVDPAGTIAAIRAAAADIVLLQETGGTLAPMLAGLYADYPYRTDCNGPCDTIILSRLPILASDWRFRDARGRRIGPRLVWARIGPPGEAPFTVVSIHLPRNPGGQALAEARQGLAAVLPRRHSERLILAGDMNLTPWSYALADQDAALAPLVRLTRAVPTYPARLFGRAVSFALLPIDHVYAGPGWRVARIERLAPSGSDHRGIVATLARAR